MAAPLPPPTPQGNSGLTPEQQARIDRLARRGTSSSRRPPEPTSQLTAEQQARIDRLARRGTPSSRRPPEPTSQLTAEQQARIDRLSRRSTSTQAAAPRPGRARRKHPARGARAAALGMSLASTAALAGVFATVAAAPSAESPAVVVSGAAAGSNSAPVARTTRSTQPVVVDGGVFRNKWGPVQVEATFAPDGTLAEVTALQTPDDRGRSIDINDRAVPRLTTAALTSQSASVDTVSGATYTSDGYRRSLQSAIDAARDAGLTSIA